MALPGLIEQPSPTTRQKEGTVTNRLLTVAIVSTFMAVGGSPTASIEQPGPKNFLANLGGFEENPSLSTAGHGHLSLRIDDERETIEYELTYDELEGVGTTPFVTNGVVLFAHIHIAAPGVNGGVSTFLCGGGGTPACPTPSGSVSGIIEPDDIVGPAAQGVNPGEPTAFHELVRSIRAGYAYANLHTTRWPGGEIRGQIVVGERGF
jgi:hypothetical protein